MICTATPCRCVDGPVQGPGHATGEEEETGRGARGTSRAGERRRCRNHGPAARWASNVSIGDLVNIQGPGACKRLNHDADWFLLAGDMTALPAISVNLELLPKDAKGYAVLEVISEEDRIELNAPDGVEVIWVINPNPTALNSELSDTFTELPWMQGQVSAWVAGEFNTSRVLRRYIRHERKVERDFTYISCYWKIGETDEGMKAAKRNDKEPW